MAFKSTHCIYGLRDQYGNPLGCPVLERIGNAIKVEDLPKYCELCPMRVMSLGSPLHSLGSSSPKTHAH
ncbi:MAG: hypothetical protein QXU06_04315 [Candidatus Bathyarchaeia archaeon]